MDRKTLTEVLSRAPGVEQNKTRYLVGEQHRLTFYLGQPGQAMVVNEVKSCSLEDAFVELVTRDDATMFVAYEAIHAVADRPSQLRQDRRAGFS